MAQRPTQPPVPLVSQDTAPRGPEQWEGPQGLGTGSATGVRGRSQAQFLVAVGCHWLWREVPLRGWCWRRPGCPLASAMVMGRQEGLFGPGHLASNLGRGCRSCVAEGEGDVEAAAAWWKGRGAAPHGPPAPGTERLL